MTMKLHHNHVRAAVGFAAIAFSCVALADGYEDAVIATDDASVRAIVLPTRFAYVFTNTSGSVTVTLKDAERVNRTLVVAGGGAGGSGVGGGGGGGGVLHNESAIDLVANAEIAVTVGAGGQGSSTAANVTSGSDSTLAVGGNNYVAIGGGRGGNWNSGTQTGVSGGSGGGGAMNRGGRAGTSGQGYAGGSHGSARPGGGGGASSAGGTYDASVENRSGAGGEGFASDITGAMAVYGSGGGGGSGSNGSISPAVLPGFGGTNAGNGGGNSGLDGFGGGGGGGAGSTGGNGGSGTVIIGFAPTTEGIVTVASDTDVPDASLPNTGYGSFLTKTNMTISVADSTATDSAVRFLCKGYAVETYDSALDSWSSPVTNAVSSFSFSDVAGKCVRVTWLWGKTLDADTIYEDRAIMSTIPFAKTKVADGDFAYVFTDIGSTGTVLLKANAIVSDALVVAGGGAGGFSIGGGGGGGGVIAASGLNLQLVVYDTFTLSVGAGGVGSQTLVDITNGGDSSLAFASTNFVAIGGGRGGSWNGSSYAAGSAGGSGGGGTYNGTYGKSGAGTVGQGNAGAAVSSNRPGGGGGASVAGSQYASGSNMGGAGGEGLSSSITGSENVYGSGGGGGCGNNSVVTTELSPGIGGTNAGDGDGNPGVDGFGGGGGGGRNDKAGGNGGSGTVVIRLLPDLPKLGFSLIFK